MPKVNTRKRGEYWEWRFEGARVDGKRTQCSKSGYRTKKDAEEAGTAAYNEYIQAGIKVQISGISFADYIDQWFDLYVRAQLRYNTQLAYLSVLENYLKPAFGKYRLVSLNAAAIQEFVNGLRNKGLARASMVNIYTVLRESLTYAVEPMKYLKYNPMLYVKLPESIKPKTERSVVSPEDWERIIARFPEGSRFYVPLMIGRYTGLRISEAFALTWDDVDFEKGVINIDKQVVKRNYGTDVRKVYKLKGKKEEFSSWYFAPTKTNSSVRTMLVGKALLDCLAKEKKRQEKNEAEYGDYYTVHVIKPEEDEKGQKILRIVPCQKVLDPQLQRARLICVDENGQYTSTDSFKYPSRIIHNELHILSFDFHSLRHTMATSLLDNGASIKAVQKRLGHASVNTTLNTYVHTTEKMESESVDILENLYDSLTTGSEKRGQTVGVDLSKKGKNLNFTALNAVREL